MALPFLSKYFVLRLCPTYKGHTHKKKSQVSAPLLVLCLAGLWIWVRRGVKGVMEGPTKGFTWQILPWKSKEGASGIFKVFAFQARMCSPTGSKDSMIFKLFLHVEVKCLTTHKTLWVLLFRMRIIRDIGWWLELASQWQEYWAIWASV